MPAILDSLFHKVVNTTSILIGVEDGGGGEPQSSWALRYNLKSSLWPTGFNWVRFQLHMSATSMPSLPMQLVL